MEIVDQMEQIKPATSSDLGQSVTAVALTGKTAETDMKSIYAVKFPDALSAVAKNIESEDKSYESEDKSYESEVGE
jgi:hypothetical protein